MEGREFVVKFETDPTKTKSRCSSSNEVHSRDEYAQECQTINSIHKKSTLKVDDVHDQPDEDDTKYINATTIIQLVSLVFIVPALACSLTISELKKQCLWDLPLWKWEILLLVLICGRLLSGWGVRIAVFLIEHNFLFQNKVLYFVYGLRKAVQNCLWLGLVLSVWNWILNEKVTDSNSKILHYVTKILVCFLVGTCIWLLKTVLIKVFALSFHVSTFFDRMQKCILSKFIIKNLSDGTEIENMDRHEESESIATEIQHSRNAGVNVSAEFKAFLLPRGPGNRKLTGTGGPMKIPKLEKSSKFSWPSWHDEEIKFDHLYRLNRKNVSPWNMTKLVEIVQQSLTTLDEQILDDADNDQSSSLTDEFQAKAAAKKIFCKVAKTDPKLLGEDKASRAMDLMCGAERQHRISKSSFKKWVVNAFKERKILASTLKDTHTAVDKLHNMLNFIIAIIILIVSLVILGLPIAHFLIFISSQLLLVVFIFGNTCKTTFEALVFLFIMHPFDVGDRCEVDGHELVVEEMNILTTIFQRPDNQKIIYPNSILSTKSITNFRRSGDITEGIEFCIHVSTPMRKIAEMKSKIKSYIETTNKHWLSQHLVVTIDVENMNKLRMKVVAGHRMNNQDVVERLVRRAALVEELIKIFRTLDIEYRAMPVDMNVRNMPGVAKLPSIWETCSEGGSMTVAF
ncbi:Mechanosensitive ion channel MscS [Dillenia turbinata]|uniref:Mechanosensitive ion channel protein n=1 Tax=Dillenia turbinata TaxID=194707 RepID=A0AAN8VZN6_9MAGN